MYKADLRTGAFYFPNTKAPGSGALKPLETSRGVASRDRKSSGVKFRCNLRILFVPEANCILGLLAHVVSVLNLLPADRIIAKERPEGRPFQLSLIDDASPVAKFAALYSTSEAERGEHQERNRPVDE